MISRELYADFCNKHPTLPIFYQPFYLDVTCGGQWEAMILEKGGRVFGIWPLFIKRKGPISYVSMPHLTKFMGPWFPAPLGESKNYYRLCREIIAQLPHLSVFKQNFHYSINNWIPFYREGFYQTTLYSYQLSLHLNKEELLAAMCGDYKNNKIPRADKAVFLDEQLQVAEFFRLAEASYKRQGLSLPVDKHLIENLYHSLSKKKQATLLGARDRDGNLHASLFLIWDGTTAYNLMAGDDPHFRNSGAGIWLAWQAILYSKEKTNAHIFDFLGSMKPSIERVRQNFGAQPVPYFQIKRYHSRWWKLLDVVLRKD